MSDAGTPQDRANAGHDHFPAEGLANVVVGAKLKAYDFTGDVTVLRKQNDRRLILVAANPQQYQAAVQHWQVNVEQNHALLAGHTFEHEIALAQALGIFGSIDMNRGDELLGWDTDQFPNNAADLLLPLYVIYKNGGFTTGGFNFDAKVRRQSFDAVDLFRAHVGAIDVTARALLAVEQIIKDGKLEGAIKERYAGWSGPLGKEILSGKATLESLSQRVLEKNVDVAPVSGRQEALENLLNRYL